MSVLISEITGKFELPWAPPRTALFVPADATTRHGTALESGADAVFFDLEDAIAPGDKEEARRALAASEALRARGDGPAALVRVNSPATEEGQTDLDLVASLAVDGLVVPKAEPDTIATAARAGLPLVALVETARGILAVAETAADPAVCLLMLGAVDLGAELGVEEADDGDELLTARSQLVLASAAAGLPAPLDSPCIQVREEARLKRQLARARRLGFSGKACIHPAQVAIANETFSATADEVDWARRVVASSEAAGDGVVVLDGQMIDRPVALRARQILNNHERGSKK